MRKGLLSFITVLLLMVTLASSSCAGDSSMDVNAWPMEGGDHRHTGLSAYELADSNGTLRWVLILGDEEGGISGAVPSPIVGADDRVYAITCMDRMEAVDWRGHRLWSVPLGPLEGVGSPALLPNGTIIAPTVSEKTIWRIGGSQIIVHVPGISAFGPDGSRLWSYQALDSYRDISSIVMAPDSTILVSFKAIESAYWPGWHLKEFAILHAISPDGELLWQSKISGSVLSSPAVADNGTIYVGTFSGVTALNAQGETLWNCSVGSATRSSPVVGEDGTIYFGSDNGGLHALHPNGTLKWSFDIAEAILASPALGPDGTIYVGSYDGSLYAVSPNGSLQWSFRTDGRMYSSPAVSSDGKVVVSAFQDAIYAIDAGVELWTFPTPEFRTSSPVLGEDGSVFFLTADGRLFSLNLRWPSPPQSLFAIGGNGTVNVTWATPANGGSAPMMGFNVYRGVDLTQEHLLSGAWKHMPLYATVDADTTYFLDANVTNGRSYYYHVTAFNSVGESDRSGLAAATPPEGPGVLKVSDFEIDSRFYTGVIAFWAILAISLLLSGVVLWRTNGLPLVSQARGFLRKSAGFLVRPADSFEKVKDEGWFITIRYYVTWLGVTLPLIILSGGVISKGATQSLFETFGTYGSETVLIALIAVLLAGVLLLILSAIAVYFVVLMGNGKGFYLDSVRSLVYSSIPAFLIGWVPFLLLIPVTWSFALLTVGVSKLHHVGYLRAILVILVSVALVTFFFLISIMAGII